MIAMPDIVTLKVKIGHYQGIALAEKYPEGYFIILDRIYKSLSDVEIEIATKNGWEKIVEVISDWGELFESSVPNKEG